MAPERAQQWEKWSLIFLLFFNVVMLAYSYGQMNARIAGIEAAVQNVKEDIHELRGVVLKEQK